MAGQSLITGHIGAQTPVIMPVYTYLGQPDVSKVQNRPISVLRACSSLFMWIQFTVISIFIENITIIENRQATTRQKRRKLYTDELDDYYFCYINKLCFDWLKSDNSPEFRQPRTKSTRTKLSLESPFIRLFVF